VDLIGVGERKVTDPAGVSYRQYINTVLPATLAPKGAVLPLTEPDILGPFYLAGAPFQRNIVPANYSYVMAEPLVLTGYAYVLGADGVKTPAAGFVLDFWQADAEGVYDNQDWPNPQEPPRNYSPSDYRFRGKQTVLPDGSYKLITVKPGHYGIGKDAKGVEEYRTSHLHCRIWDGEKLLLTTQLYFPHDMWNAQDHWYSPDRQIADGELVTGGVVSLVGVYNLVVAG
jgi:protocatechuate 3,4-dioxygenase beta subunit